MIWMLYSKQILFINKSFTYFLHTHTHTNPFLFFDMTGITSGFGTMSTGFILMHWYPAWPLFFPFFFFFFIDTYLIYIFKLVKFLFLVKLRQDRSLIFITNFVLIKPLWRERQAHSRRFWYPRMYLFFLYSLLHYGWWVVTCQ